MKRYIYFLALMNVIILVMLLLGSVPASTTEEAASDSAIVLIANSAGDQAVDGDSAFDKLNLTASTDTESAFSDANDRYTATTAGYYYVYVTASIDQLDHSKGFAIEIRKNGTSIAPSGSYPFHASANSYNQMTYRLGGIVHMNGSTDYVEAHVMHNQGASRNISAGETQMFIYYIGT